jgi:perosamine synthetase
MTDQQKGVLKILNDNQMQSRPFWVPMNQLRMFRDDIYCNKEDNSNYIYKHCLSIPCSTNITDEEMAGVVKQIKSVYKNT